MSELTNSNSAAALSRLRGEIQGRLDVGETRFPTERELSDKLNIGRRAVRRALEVLEAEGRIWRHQGKGTFIGQKPGTNFEVVRDLGGKTNFYEVMEARLRLEPQLAFLAALKATEDDVAKMREIAERITEGADPDTRELWDGALHRQIARATGNRLLLGLFDVVDQIRQSDAWTELRERARSLSAKAAYKSHHTEIIDAIAARDPSGAERAMRGHIMTLQQNLIVAAEGLKHAAE